VQWVPESGPKPTSSAVIREGRLSCSKAATIVVVTNELLRFGVRTPEDALGSVAIMAAQKLFDETLLSSNAATEASPAGLAHGVTETAYSESPIETVALAVDKLPASSAEPVVIARPADILRVTAGLSAAPVGLRFISSQYALPGKALVVDPLSIVYASIQLEMKRSAEGTVRMEDDPAQIAAAAVISLWSANLIGIKIEGFTTWQVLDPSGVQVANLQAAP